MADVFRAKYQVLSIKAITGVGFHGITAVLALFLLLKALGM